MAKVEQHVHSHLAFPPLNFPLTSYLTPTIYWPNERYSCRSTFTTTYDRFASLCDQIYPTRSTRSASTAIPHDAPTASSRKAPTALSTICDAATASTTISRRVLTALAPTRWRVGVFAYRAVASRQYVVVFAVRSVLYRVVRCLVQLFNQSIDFQLYLATNVFGLDLDLSENDPEVTWTGSPSQEPRTFNYFSFSTSTTTWTNVEHHGAQLEFTPEGDADIWEEDDEFIFYPVELADKNGRTFQAFTMYKRVDKKVRPVSTTFSPEYEVKRRIPEDPKLMRPRLSKHPPDFIPTKHLTTERLALLEVNADGFLWPEEEKLILDVLRLNERALAFEDRERGTFRDEYFSPYKITTVPHVPWEYKNIPIPPGILEKVIDVLKLKIEAGVYEGCQSSYRSRWFCVLKKNGKLRIVHDLQPLNKVSIRDAGMLPIVDDFVEGFAGRQCYIVFDLYWGFDARKMEPESRDMTAFMTPLGLLRITSMPTGYTNSPAEFQKCMVFILQEEIPRICNVFIDDLPIKGPASAYLDEQGEPATLPENPGIRRFIWEHAKDVNRIMHKVKLAGGTFSGTKVQICRREALIVGQLCSPDGRTPDRKKVSAILDWPPLSTPKEVQRFLGLCGTVRNWIPSYSSIIRPLTELYRQDVDFVWDARRAEAFEDIKELVASAPALTPIDYPSQRLVILSVDSSNVATGMVLSQLDEQGRRRPARYGSIPMSERESRYSQPKLELFGLYRALRHWRLYIVGVENLRVEVDAKYIAGLPNSPDLQPDAAVNRWIQGILMFHFALVHIPATKF
uniref:Reverse transcriptase/retrotransposon-derived protein RNase H-like domain-containing protein n=1 Tax=Mycena chlorophos TaxID=658473 RepID=A0ABQ0L822_MYCCL|nr:predicted protein [Mycena chlorophos]